MPFSKLSAAALAGVLLLACLNAFVILGKMPIQTWDEGIYGLSGYEMVQSGNYLINTVRGAPDYWNLKPVLSSAPAVLGLRMIHTDALRPDPVQAAVTALGRQPENAGATLFRAKDDWSHSDILANNFSGGFVLGNGGVLGYHQSRVAKKLLVSGF